MINKCKVYSFAIFEVVNMFYWFLFFGSRAGILVLINDADWELEGKEEADIADRDRVSFISTLHGGWEHNSRAKEYYHDMQIMEKIFIYSLAGKYMLTVLG